MPKNLATVLLTGAVKSPRNTVPNDRRKGERMALKTSEVRNKLSTISIATSPSKVCSSKESEEALRV